MGLGGVAWKWYQSKGWIYVAPSQDGIHHSLLIHYYGVEISSTNTVPSYRPEGSSPSAQSSAAPREPHGARLLRSLERSPWKYGSVATGLTTLSSMGVKKV